MTARFNISRSRVAEISQLVWHRHGGLPDTDDTAIYLEALAAHVGDGGALRRCAHLLGRSLADDEVEKIFWLRLIRPRRYTADALAKLLRVSYRERQELRLWTFGAYDVPKAERDRLRKQRKAERERSRRKAGGSKPHA